MRERKQTSKYTDRAVTVLSGNSGESLSEVLIAILVVSLAVIALLNMVNISSTLLSKSSEVYGAKMNEHNFCEESLSHFNITGDKWPEEGDLKDYETIEASDSKVTVTMMTDITADDTEDDTDKNTVKFSTELQTTVKLYEGRYYYIFDYKTADGTTGN